MKDDTVVAFSVLPLDILVTLMGFLDPISVSALLTALDMKLEKGLLQDLLDPLRNLDAIGPWSKTKIDQERVVILIGKDVASMMEAIEAPRRFWATRSVMPEFNVWVVVIPQYILTADSLKDLTYCNINGNIKMGTGPQDGDDRVPQGRRHILEYPMAQISERKEQDGTCWCTYKSTSNGRITFWFDITREPSTFSDFLGSMPYDLGDLLWHTTSVAGSKRGKYVLENATKSTTTWALWHNSLGSRPSIFHSRYEFTDEDHILARCFTTTTDGSHVDCTRYTTFLFDRNYVKEEFPCLFGLYIPKSVDLTSIIPTADLLDNSPKPNHRSPAIVPWFDLHDYDEINLHMLD